MTTTALTVYFSKWLDRTVVDRTGLTGAFDVELQFSSEGLPGVPQDRRASSVRRAKVRPFSLPCRNNSG